MRTFQTFTCEFFGKSAFLRVFLMVSIRMWSTSQPEKRRWRLLLWESFVLLCANSSQALKRGFFIVPLFTDNCRCLFAYSPGKKKALFTTLTVFQRLQRLVLTSSILQMLKTPSLMREMNSFLLNFLGFSNTRKICLWSKYIKIIHKINSQSKFFLQKNYYRTMWSIFND